MSKIDLDRLLKLRLAVARYGEMDLARWWNTKQLGPNGAKVLRRGFPRTYHFAQARASFAVAFHRCSEILSLPGTVTLWHLPEVLEEEFDIRWEHWLDHADEWNGFFSSLESPPAGSLADVLRSFDLVSQADLAASSRLTRSDRLVPLPGLFRADDAALTQLALGFSLGEPGAPAIPYIRRED